MKNLLITAAMAVLITAMAGCWLRLHHLAALRETMKAAAEEAAAAAAMEIEAESFGNGELRFDREKARKKAEKLLKMNFPEGAEKGRWEILLNDRETKRPSVTVRLFYENLKIQSVYEYLPLAEETPAQP